MVDESLERPTNPKKCNDNVDLHKSNKKMSDTPREY